MESTQARFNAGIGPDGIAWTPVKRGGNTHTRVGKTEICERLEWLGVAGRVAVRRRYVARFQLEGETTPTLAVFERDKDGWWGITTFQGEEQQANDWRIGVRLFRRDP